MTLRAYLVLIFVKTASELADPFQPFGGLRNLTNAFSVLCLGVERKNECLISCGINVIFLKLSRIFVVIKLCFKLFFKRMNNFMPCKRHNVVNFALTAVVKLAAPCTFFFMINRIKPALSFNLSNNSLAMLFAEAEG